MDKNEESQELEAKSFEFNINDFDLIRRAVNALTNFDSCGGNRQLLARFNIIGSSLERQGLDCGFLQKPDEAQEEEPKQESSEPVEAEVVQ